MAGMSDEAKRREGCANALQHAAKERSGSVSDESWLTNDRIVKRGHAVECGPSGEMRRHRTPAFSDWHEPAGAKRRLAGECQSAATLC